MNYIRLQSIISYTPQVIESIHWVGRACGACGALVGLRDLWNYIIYHYTCKNIIYIYIVYCI